MHICTIANIPGAEGVWQIAQVRPLKVLKVLRRAANDGQRG